jgi:hypothetical protein
MTKYISSRGSMAFEETFKAAGLFKNGQVQWLQVMVSTRHVIYTDQTGCEYRINIRKLSHQGE